MSAPAQSPPAGEEGFALIEVLVSALILVIVGGGVSRSCRRRRARPASERHRSEAQAIAQEDQARLRSMRLSSSTS